MNQTMVGKPPTRGKYYCANCDSCFGHRDGILMCPECLSTIREDLILIYVREIIEEEMMHTPDDFQGG